MGIKWAMTGCFVEARARPIIRSSRTRRFAARRWRRSRKALSAIALQLLIKTQQTKRPPRFGPGGLFRKPNCRNYGLEGAVEGLVSGLLPLSSTTSPNVMVEELLNCL